MIVARAVILDTVLAKEGLQAPFNIIDFESRGDDDNMELWLQIGALPGPAAVLHEGVWMPSFENLILHVQLQDVPRCWVGEFTYRDRKLWAVVKVPGPGARGDVRVTVFSSP